MTAPSPVRSEAEPISVAVTIGGKSIGSAIPVASIEIWSGVNRVPRARPVVPDADPATGAFAISGASNFLPGQTIAVAAGYGGRNESSFSGIIVRHGIEIGTGSSPQLVVEAADPASA